MQPIQGLRNARRLVLVLLAFLLLATVIAPAQAQADCPSPLRIAYLDKAIPGMLNGDGDRFDEAPGLFVEWARSTLQRLGCSAELVRVPGFGWALLAVPMVASINFAVSFTLALVVALRSRGLGVGAQLSLERADRVIGDGLADGLDAAQH